MLLPQIGPDGQQAISRTRALCVGVGGLGSPCALYLVAAGIGTLGLVDNDHVDESNLQRQTLFGTDAIGRAKVAAATERLRGLNSEVTIEGHETRLDPGNALELFRNFDIIIDGTDNFAARFLINDAAVKLGLPVVFGSVSGFEGQLSVYWAKYGPCYRCLYPAPPKTVIENCAEAGVLGGVAGVIGSMQAVEALKLALNPREPAAQTLIGKLMTVDLWTGKSAVVRVSKNPSCAVCSTAPERIVLTEGQGVCLPEISGEAAIELGLARYFVLDVRDPIEFARGHLPNARNLPMSAMREIPIDPEGRPVLVYCQSGIRSRQAVQILTSMGVSGACQLRGGISGWTGPIVQD